MISQFGEAAIVGWLSICLSAWLLCVRYLSVLDVDIFILVNLIFLIFSTSGRHPWSWSTNRISISSNNNNKKQNKFINMVWFLYA